MRKYIFIALFLPLLSNAQYWEVGAFGGISSYSGDLTSFIDFKELHLAGGAVIRYNVNPFFTIKSNFYYGTITGNDANSRVSERRISNLSFKSSVLDIGLQAEINLLG